MKYVLIIFGVAILLRLDFIIGLFDKFKQSRENQVPVVEVTDSKSDRSIISINQDQMLKTPPKETFFTLLDSFHSSPDAELRMKAMTWLKDNPKLFGETLDKELESKIFKWRDHLNNNNSEVVNFVLDLMAVLSGENLQILNNFFALWMDINMEHFIISYSRTKDSNCSIATTFGEPVPEEEKLNEYYQRADSLRSFLQKEKIEPIQRALATNCLLQLEMLINKSLPQPTTNEPQVVLPEGTNPISPLDPQFTPPTTPPEEAGTNP